jgi:hypothetical protein
VITSDMLSKLTVGTDMVLYWKINPSDVEFVVEWKKHTWVGIGFGTTVLLLCFFKNVTRCPIQI